jgi:tetratricopeptide (TPR) repeat protein
MGRMEEGFEEFGRCRRICEEDGTPEMLGYVAFWAGEAHYFAHDVDRALANARQLEEICRNLGEPPALVGLMHANHGYAHLAAGRAEDAVASARAALEIHGRVEKGHAGMSSTLLAEALLQTGDLAAAEAEANRAIATCRLSLRGNLEAVAHGVLARARLRQGGRAVRGAAEASLGDAAALIELTGAAMLAPALCKWRAEVATVLGDDAASKAFLREAQQGYANIGAPRHAERIAQELAS